MGFAPPAEALRQSVPCLSRGFWIVAGSPWHPMASGYVTPVSSVAQLPLPALVRTPLLGFQAHPKSRTISSPYSQFHLQRLCFRVRARSHLAVLSYRGIFVGARVCLWGMVCSVSLESSPEPLVALSSSSGPGSVAAGCAPHVGPPDA